MNRRQLLVGAVALLVTPTTLEARYRVPICLIEDTCVVPFSGTLATNAWSSWLTRWTRLLPTAETTATASGG